MKRLAVLMEWVAARVPQRSKWIGFFTILLLAGVAIGKPVYVQVDRPGSDRWTKAVVIEAQGKCAASLDAAADFGRELDTLTTFYETVITGLLGLLALVGGLAYYSVKFVSRTQAEEAARDAAEKILGGHDGFSNKLRDLVSKEVAGGLAEVNAKLSSMEESVPQTTVVVKPQAGQGRRRGSGRKGAKPPGEDSNA
jgi:hypothetical protein